MKTICVVHLVRAQNGINPFRRFLDSYSVNLGGVEHDLLLVFKGFGLSQNFAEYRELLSLFRYTILEVSDEGFDITAYFAAVRHYSEQYSYFCFLNSYSVILDNDWLRKLYEQISKPSVGLVGASGSWQSLNPWGGLFQRRKMRSRFTINDSTLGKKFGFWVRAGNGIVSFWRLFSFPIFFPVFPNYHLRTNSFMISSELMLMLDQTTIKTKIDACRFESGKNGLTRQVLAMGKEVLVIGKDGLAYKLKQWNSSNTFWQGEQENLLVADNQTNFYQNACLEQRKYMSFNAWRIKS
jgi:hypothetical protein